MPMTITDVTTVPHKILEYQRNIAMMEVQLAAIEEAMHRATNESQRMAYRSGVNSMGRQLENLRSGLRALESTDGNSSY